MEKGKKNLVIQVYGYISHNLEKTTELRWALHRAEKKEKTQ